MSGGALAGDQPERQRRAYRGFRVVRLPQFDDLAVANLGPHDTSILGARVCGEVVAGRLCGAGQSYPGHPLDDPPSTQRRLNCLSVSSGLRSTEHPVDGECIVCGADRERLEESPEQPVCTNPWCYGRDPEMQWEPRRLS